jgi:WD40 repeat protein
VFGYDVFISYKRGESTAYAASLYRQLTDIDLVCFLDDHEAPLGVSLTPTIKRALTRSRVLVLVASREALSSDWVHKELEDFSKTGRRILPINLLGALSSTRQDNPIVKLLAERDIVWYDESPDVVPSGSPSDETAERVRSFFSYVRARRLGRVTTGLVVAILAAATVVATLEAVRARTREAQAKEAARIALARDLAAESELVRETEVDQRPLSALLAVEAVRRDTSVAADSALRRALGVLPRTAFVAKADAAFTNSALSPDGRTIVATTASDIEIFDIRGRRDLIKAPAVDAIAISPDGTRFAAASRDEILVGDISTANVVARFATASGFNSTSIVCTAGCEYLASVARQEAAIWQLQGSKPVWQANLGVPLEQVGVSADGMRVLVAASHGYMTWDLRKDRTHPAHSESSDPDNVHDSWIASPDGSRVAHWDREDRQAGLTVFEAASGAVLQRLYSDKGFLSAAFGYNADALTTTTVNRDLGHTVQVWNSSSGKEVGRHVVTDLEVIYEIGLSQDSRFLLLLGKASGNALRVFDLSSHEEYLRKPLSESPSDIGLDGPGQLLALAFQDRVELLQVATGAALAAFPGQASAVALSPDGGLIAMATDGAVKIWPTGQPIKQPLQWAFEGARHLAFSSGGDAVGAVANGHLAIWSLTKHSTLHEEQDPHISSLALALGPKGEWASFDIIGGLGITGGLGLLDYRKRDAVSRLAANPGLCGIFTTFASLNGRFAVGACQGEKTVIWTADESAPIKLVGDDRVPTSIEAVAITADGQFIDKADSVGLSVVSVQNQQTVANLTPPGDILRVRRAAFSGDGMMSAVVNEDNVLFVWILSSDRLVREACKLLEQRRLTPEEWSHYIPAEQRRDSCAF